MKARTANNDMPRKMFTLAMLIHAGASVACGADQPRTKTYRTDGFSIIVPESTDVKKTTPIDFDLIGFKFQGSVILDAYAGNAPNFPLESDSFAGVKEERSSVNGLPVRSLTKKQAGGKFSRQVLLDLSSRQKNWPLYVHLWYSDLSEHSAHLVDAMIGSVKYNPPEKEVEVPPPPVENESRGNGEAGIGRSGRKTVQSCLSLRPQGKVCNVFCTRHARFREYAKY